MRIQLRFFTLLIALGAIPAIARPTAQTAVAPQVQTTQPTTPGQPTPPLSPVAGHGAISGVVIDATTKAPLAGALVTISTSNGRPVVVGQQTKQMTDSKGRFIFPGLGAWSGYTLTATKSGYFGGAYGNDRPGTASRSIALTEGEWFPSAQIGLFRGSSISGRVTDERGEPVVGIYVRVLPRLLAAGQQRLVSGPLAVTDDRGLYRVPGLAAGRYLVQVPSVQASVPAALPSYAIAGMTAESAARSTQPVPIEAALDLDPSAKLILSKYPTPPPSPDGRAWTYPIEYHPGTALLAQAIAIELKYGDDRLNADIRLEPSPTSKITGVVQGPPEAMAGLTLRLIPAGLEDLGQGSEAATALVGEGGAFGFVNVPPGAYSIFTSRSINEYTSNGSVFVPGLPGPPGRFGSSSTSSSVDSAPSGTSFMYRNASNSPSSVWLRTPITIAAGRDMTDLTLTLLRTVTVSGKVVFEPVDPLQPGTMPDQTNRTIGVEPATGAAWLAATSDLGQSKPAPPGEFLVDGLLGGEYVFKSGFVNGWTLKSITINGRDVTYAPFDTANGADITGAIATFTNATTTLAGSVTNPQPGSPLEAAVIVFPVERDQWTKYGIRSSRIKSMRVSSTGAFSFANLPAGDYLLIGVAAADVNAWQDPAFLQRVAATATRVTLGWGDKKSIALGVAGR